MIKSEEAKQRIEDIADALCYLQRFDIPKADPMTAEDVLAICSAASGISIEDLTGKLKHGKDLHFVAIQYACIWALWHFAGLGFGTKRYIRCWGKTLLYALDYTKDCIESKGRVFPMVQEIIAGCQLKNRRRVEALYSDGKAYRAETKHKEVQALLSQHSMQWCNNCPYFKDRRCPLGSVAGLVTDGFCPRLSLAPHGEHTKLLMPEKSLQSLSWVWIN